MSEIIEGANESQLADVTETADDTGVKESQPADVNVATEETDAKNSTNEAWANMRRTTEEAERRAEEAERKLAEMEAQAEARAEAMRQVGGDEDADITALAEAVGEDPETIRAVIEAEERNIKIANENRDLKTQNENLLAEKNMREELTQIQAIDPSIKTVEDLGDDYAKYIAAGLSGVDAYYAIKGKEITNSTVAPKEIGKVGTSAPEKDFVSEAEYDRMSSSQRKKFHKIIMRSMSSW